MNALHQEYLDDLQILGFPCNQFYLQEPASNTELLSLLEHVRPGDGYVPSFQMFEKLDVNGENEHSLYTQLKSVCPAVKMDIGNPDYFFWSPIRNNDITWNFEKFLIDDEGVPYKRYDPMVLPDELKDDIDALIRKRDASTSPPTENITPSSGAASSCKF